MQKPAPRPGALRKDGAEAIGNPMATTYHHHSEAFSISRSSAVTIDKKSRV